MTQPSGTDPDDFARMIIYRRADDLAADLIEPAGRDWAGYGAADLPEWEARRLAERIAEEVSREMGPDANQDAVSEGIADALARQRPRW